MSPRDDKKKEKEKDKRNKNLKFDSNIDVNNIREESHSTSDNSSTKSGSSDTSKRSKTESSSDMVQLGKILQSGFKTVTDTISSKLDNVGKNFSDGLDNLQQKLNDKLVELSTLPDEESQLGEGRSLPDEGDEWEGASENSKGERQSTHAMSDTNSEKGESFFKKKNTTTVPDKVGEDVDPDLAEIANRAFQKPMTSEKFKDDFKTKYRRPNNVDWLRAPDIPFNIYRRLSSEFKDKDKALLHVQEMLVPVGNSLVTAMNKLDKGDFQEGMETLSDTLQGFGYVFSTGITEKRRSNIKSKLPDDYKVLVSDKCPPTPSSILGNISENSKQVSEGAKIEVDEPTTGPNPMTETIRLGRLRPQVTEEVSSTGDMTTEGATTTAAVGETTNPIFEEEDRTRNRGTTLSSQ